MEFLTWYDKASSADRQAAASLADTTLGTMRVMVCNLRKGKSNSPGLVARLMAAAAKVDASHAAA